MKKLLLKTTVLAALAAIFLTVTAAAADLGTAVVDATGLRLRSEPNTSSKILTHLNDGDTVGVLELLDGWYKVSYGSYIGYVSADYMVYVPAETMASAPKEEAPAVSGTEATINSGSVSFCASPSAESNILATLSMGTKVQLQSTDSGWCQVVVNGQAGYVNAEFVTVDGAAVENSKGIVTGDCVNVRTGPGTDNAILTKVYAGNVIELLSKENGWYAMRYNGVSGYISADYVREYVPSTDSSQGQDIADLALSFVGTPYVYGGMSPKGFDCSGFTLYVFSQFGYTLPHSATSQWYNSGEKVAREDLQPGDLVMFCDPAAANGKACSHVGVYIGNGDFVHAASGRRSGRQVRINNLSESYWDGYYVGAKRVG